MIRYIKQLSIVTKYYKHVYCCYYVLLVSGHFNISHISCVPEINCSDIGDNKLSYQKRVSFLWCSIVQLVYVDINNFLLKVQTRESILSCHSKLQFMTSTDTLWIYLFGSNLSYYFQISFILQWNNWVLTRTIPITFFSHPNYVCNSWLYLSSAANFLLHYVASMNIVIDPKLVEWLTIFRKTTVLQPLFV